MDILKNDEYTASIDGYTSEGAGVAHIGGYPVFIPYTVRGDIVRVHIVKVGKSFGFGKCVEVLHSSEQRCKPICPHYYACGGCAIMHMSDDERRFFKYDKVKNALRHIAGLEVPVAKVACDEEIGYRNKTQMPVSADYIQAMYKTRSNIKVNVPHCVLQEERCRTVTETILAYLKEKEIAPYDPTTGEGIVRHIYTRISQATSEILAVLVLTKAIDLSELKPRLSGMVVGLVMNIQKERTNKILGDTGITVFGKDHITDSLCGVDFDIYPDSFFQVNRFLTQRLYNKVIKLAQLTGHETVFDLYCGAGTITAALARSAKRVIGIEIVPSAVRSAKESLSRAGFDNVEFYEGAAECIAPQLIKKGALADVVVLDPPRKGCEKTLLEAVLSMRPSRIVYVSCDPATLARDLKILSGAYRAEVAYPFDMFPFTHHIETVVLLSRDVIRNRPGVKEK